MAVPEFPFAEDFTILSRTVTGQDSYGDDVYGTTETPVTGAFAPAGSTELTDGRDTVMAFPTIYLTAGSLVPAATDQIRREATGYVYEIDGEPAVYRNPFNGDQPGAVLRLKRVTG